MNPRGFTLPELLITMVVMGILGLALARILINNSQFVSQQDAMMEAREGARSAVNVMSPELRVISDGGLIAAQRDSIRARVPYAFGVVCAQVAGTTYATLMPTDSLIYASATLGGLVWQTTSRMWSSATITGITVSSTALTAPCDLPWPSFDSIRVVVPGGQRIQFGSMSAAQTRPPGTLFYLYQNVTYRFRPSVDLPGRRGLWRRAGAAAYEELVAPFDTSARFAFLMGPNLQVDTRPNFTTQVRRDSIRGLELRLVAASQYIPQGKAGYQNFDMRTSVLFLNRMP